MDEVIVYTDGACSGNPGPGGWAAYMEFKGKIKTISGGEAQTTNNRMEMTAAIKALKALKRSCRVVIHSDSALLINAFAKGWIDSWQRKGWKKADKKPVENQDLWKDLLSSMNGHEVVWKKVKGHADNEINNLVDELAVAESKKF
ncbi:MAG TPA: ribonuclease HI [Balneolales bacterium]|nr:ribonuclease HI [Balneolales bacterium]